MCFKQEVKILAGEKRNPTCNTNPMLWQTMSTSIRWITGDHWKRYSNEMEHDLYRGQKKIWNLLSNTKKPINDYFQNNKIKPYEWERPFEKLYSVRAQKLTRQHKTHQKYENGLPTQTKTIFLEKIYQVVTELKDRKTPDIDEIKNEVIKYGG